MYSNVGGGSSNFEVKGRSGLSLGLLGHFQGLFLIKIIKAKLARSNCTYTLVHKKDLKDSNPQ